MARVMGRKPVWLVVVVAFAAILGRATSAPAGFVVAYWRFEEGTANATAPSSFSILDSSGNHLDGLALNGPLYQAAVAADPVPQTGAPNALSLRFNGANQRVFISDDPLFHLTQSLTVEAWVNVRSAPTAGNNAQILFRGDDRPGLDPYFLAVQGNTLAFSIQNALNQSAAVIAPLPGLNEWIHVAGTLDDSTGALRLYINGTLAASLVTGVRPFAVLDPSFSPGLGIGNVQSANGAQYFDGLIDEVRISNRALGPGEFLNANTVPEPNALRLATVGIGAIVLVGLVRRAGKT